MSEKNETPDVSGVLKPQDTAPTGRCHIQGIKIPVRRSQVTATSIAVTATSIAVTTTSITVTTTDVTVTTTGTSY
jgi:hypothetical protein